MSSEVSSEIGEIFLWKILFVVFFFLDSECFLNFLDVSIIRENKMEILWLYEDLKVKIFVIKDLLSWMYGLLSVVYDGKFEIKVSYEVKSELGFDFLMDSFKSNSVLLWFSKVECVKLLSLLFWLKEELVWERKINNDGWIGGDGSDICFFYDNLESKFFWFLCEFVIKEDKIM